ncbi:hypothetical protein LIER_41597 [Lithospermum erythrorhizon]|uniref:Uncharacterized protein n=1 Tax=Lithospermum erythrorhizon TaxID=34254 RepID=A0AAV3RF59_LITER
MEDVHRLHKLKQILIDGSRGMKYHGCIKGISPDTYAPRGRGENGLLHRIRHVLLESHALRVEECRGYIPENGEKKGNGASLGKLEGNIRTAAGQ